AQVSTTGVSDAYEGIQPGVSSLGLVTPNPVYESAVIPVTVAPQDIATAKLTVFDVYGRQVADLTSLVTDTGYRNIVWDAEDIPAGVHFVRLETASGVSVRRIVSAVR
ncbi:MAG: T9SS type A sorting domain-containing protein, partial [Candidatus Fermentibacteraceae bacterium]|nr:T9SS type A sorting domain-containing protein [Candidatus Fermentibacteraceae bacterium]